MSVSLQVVQHFADKYLASDASMSQIQNFLLAPNVTGNYATIFTDLSNACPANGKILLCLDDGTVIVDTSKTTYNIFQNYLNKFNPNGTSGYAINENHASRPEIQLATLSTSGVGWSSRFSSSDGILYTYYAIRLGTSVNNNLGTIRFAMKA